MLYMYAYSYIYIHLTIRDKLPFLVKTLNALFSSKT